MSARMPRTEIIGFVLATQVLTGFLVGPAIAFAQVYGSATAAVHFFIALVAITLYGIWMLREGRRKARRHSPAALRAGLFATLLFCIVGTAVLASGLPLRVDPLSLIVGAAQG